LGIKRTGNAMLKRTIRRYGRIVCLSAVMLGGLSLNGCFFIGGHGHGGWHHHDHDHWDRW